MGVTIHYRLELSHHAQLPALLAAAREFANARGWPIHEIDDASLLSPNIFPFGGQDGGGSGSGVVIVPDEHCEPVMLVFGPDLVAIASTKTQYAGAEVHMDVVSLLDALTPHVLSIDVTDEAEFWQTRDASSLRRRLMTRDELRAERRGEAPAPRDGNGRLASRRPS